MTDRSRTIQFRDRRLRPALVSLAVSVLMLIGKVSAYLLTNSAAIFSDAAESVIHIVATAVVALSIWYSLKPADPSHPYGHGKANYFAAGLEGALITLAAGTIIYSAILDLIRGPELQQLGLGLVILGLLTAVNLVLGLYLIRSGRRYNNIGLISNGQHVLADMWTSLGVIGGVTLVWLTNIVWFDPLVAIAVALNILWSGYNLIRRGYLGLMDTTDPEDTQIILHELNRAAERGKIEGYHQVRHRSNGDQRWIEYHLLFDGAMTLEEAHELSHDVEDRITAHFDNETVVITAHLEPSEHDEAHPQGHIEPEDPLAQIME